MWQKCPACNGSGEVFSPLHKWGNGPTKPCHTCKGSGIINQATGKPPATTSPKIIPIVPGIGTWPPIIPPTKGEHPIHDYLDLLEARIRDLRERRKKGCSADQCFCTGACKIK